MRVTRKDELVLDHRIDRQTFRHYLLGSSHVLHCHHYATLYCQLAEDCEMLDGKRLLAEAAEDSFYQVLTDHFKEQNVEDMADRISIAEQYYAAVGLGKMEVKCAGPESGEVELVYSHVDQGWIKKWGNYSKPVNFITWGYIAALFAAVFGRSPRSFSVLETASIVSGAERSRFEVLVN